MAICPDCKGCGVVGSSGILERGYGVELDWCHRYEWVGVHFEMPIFLREVLEKKVRN